MRHIKKGTRKVELTEADVDSICVRDKFICYLCGGVVRIDKKAIGWNSINNKDCPSLDRVYDADVYNMKSVKISHYKCNTFRNDNYTITTLDEMTGFEPESDLGKYYISQYTTYFNSSKEIQLRMQKNWKIELSEESGESSVDISEHIIDAGNRLLLLAIDKMHASIEEQATTLSQAREETNQYIDVDTGEISKEFMDYIKPQLELKDLMLLDSIRNFISDVKGIDENQSLCKRISSYVSYNLWKEDPNYNWYVCELRRTSRGQSNYIIHRSSKQLLMK